METLVESDGWVQLVILGPLGLLLACAAVIDAVTASKNEEGKGRIPNQLTYSSVLLGLICHAAVFGLGGLWAGLAAVVLTFAVGIVLAGFGLIGGGDVKLLMGVGAFLGLSGLGEVLFYAVLAGAVLGLVFALFTGYLKVMVLRLFRFLRGVVRMLIYRTSMVREDLETDPRSRMPFAVPILAGAILAYLEAATGWPGLLEWFLGPFFGR